MPEPRGVAPTARHVSCFFPTRTLVALLPRRQSGPARDRLMGGEMRYILAIFVGILLLIFGVVGGLLDLIF